MAADIPFGAFLDAEDTHKGSRDVLRKEANCTFAGWDGSGVRNIEEAVASWLPLQQLGELIEHTADFLNCAQDSMFQKIGDAAGRPGKNKLDRLVADIGEQQTRTAVALAMADHQPGNSKAGWYKSVVGGSFLADQLIALGCPDHIRTPVEDFLTNLMARVT